MDREMRELGVSIILGAVIGIAMGFVMYLSLWLGV